MQRIANTGARATNRNEYTRGVPAQFIDTKGNVRKGYEGVVVAFKDLQSRNGGFSQAEILGNAVLALAAREALAHQEALAAQEEA